MLHARVDRPMHGCTAPARTLTAPHARHNETLSSLEVRSQGPSPVPTNSHRVRFRSAETDKVRIAGNRTLPPVSHARQEGSEHELRATLRLEASAAHTPTNATHKPASASYTHRKHELWAPHHAAPVLSNLHRLVALVGELPLLFFDFCCCLFRLLCLLQTHVLLPELFDL